ncbi:TerB N-terminal domain-containing protein [Leptolyngbya sp. AN02str]|uniref:tellurite resistance TerB family protein n=1 Tax=Leptolyngbya sp. AN02str TaxID=3423363 RepID=UPI003D3212B1
MLKWVWRFLTGQQDSTTAEHSSGSTVSQPKKVSQNKSATISTTASSQKGDLPSINQSSPSRPHGTTQINSGTSKEVTETFKPQPAEVAKSTKSGQNSFIASRASKAPASSISQVDIPSARLKSTSSTKVSTAPAQWIPAGQTVTIAGYTISGGMLYVGTKLAAICDYGGIEPCLINPQLNVDRAHPDREGCGLSYWPSYSKISPACRAAYLEWLAGGRCDLSAPIGYVFLFFYGLERRVLQELRGARTEIAQELRLIVAEVERLLSIYGLSNSFNGYATRFLEICKLLGPTIQHSEVVPPLTRTAWELPLRIRLGLGQLVAEQKPIPADWALSWYVHSPQAKLRTPATRCSSEFQQLFRLRYEQQFGQGLVIKPNKTKLKANYHAASASFGGSLVELDVGDLPDVAALSAPLNRLQILVDECTDALEPFSRWLGRNPKGQGSHAAIALLPPELVKASESEDTKTFRQWLEGCLGCDEQTIISSKDLLQHWQPDGLGKLAKADVTMLLQFLEKQGYGVEPDLRFGGKALSADGNAVLFRLPLNYPETPAPEYTAATLLLHLATAIVGADNSVEASEQAYLELHLETALDLSEPERLRLRAHLKWLLQEKLSLRGVKTRLDALSPGKRMSIAQFLIRVAGADGHISPKEIAVLAKIYPLLGLDPQEVYSHIHNLSTSEPRVDPAVEPITVRPASSAQKGFVIPASPPTASAEMESVEPSFTLDLKLIEAKKAESAAVAAILGDIFVDDEQLNISPVPTAPLNSNTIAGLDSSHSALVHRLSERSIWNRSEVEQIVAELGLMIDGALEIINDAALDKCEELLTEGDEPIEINADVLEGLLS